MKKIMKLFFVAACMVMVLQPLHVSAMNKDVTKTIAASEKKKIKKLTRNFEAVFLGYDGIFYLSGQKKVLFDFNKHSDRKAALKYIAMLNYKTSVNKLSKRCFGTTTKMKRSRGDAGSILSTKIKKILKTGKKKYVVKGNAYAEDWSGEGGKKKMGTFTLTIRKKSGSYYGYVAKKLVYQAR